MRSLIQWILLAIVLCPALAQSVGSIEVLSRYLRAKQSENGASVIYVKNMTTGAVKYNMNGRQVFATASNFKWYVLYSVARRVNSGKLSWNTPVKISQAWMSIYNNKYFYTDLAKEDGTRTIEQLSEAMISISDNTATDHLMRFIGIENVYEDMKRVNQHARLNYPLLTTSQAFIMKAYNRPRLYNGLSKTPIELGKYYRSQKSSIIKKDILRYIDKNLDIVSAERAIREGDSRLGLTRWWDDTRYTDSIEWFSDADSLCKTISLIYDLAYKEKGNTLYRVMSSYRIYGTSFYEYGSKSGLESGVSTMSSFFKKRRTSDLTCVVTAINNHTSNTKLKLAPSAWSLHKSIFSVFANQSN